MLRAVAQPSHAELTGAASPCPGVWGRLPRIFSSRARRTLLANDSKARKESNMAISGRHQSPKPTVPQLASLGTLPPGIQTDAIEGHRADHLLHLHGWLTTTACLPTVQ